MDQRKRAQQTDSLEIEQWSSYHDRRGPNSDAETLGCSENIHRSRRD